ncbi:hypothetical protein N9A94_00220 [Akkermansiaceae bacterium]|nr:hypothetical protein [Akkermansiaceae bacterium]
MNIQCVSKCRSGFALIAAVSVLILLTMVGMAFLSVTAVVVKSSQSDLAMEEARANARLGLIIALGELQREMGPDRSVSVSAEIMDQDPTTLKIDGVKHPHWLGYYSTVYEGSQSGSPWSRADRYSGSMQDARGGLNYEAKDAVNGYFVSGNEGGWDRIVGARRPLDAINADLGDEEDWIWLINSGTVKRDSDRVRVKSTRMMKYLLQPNGEREFIEKGSYGYWVGSLGARAAASVADRHRDEVIDGEGGGIQRLLCAQDVEMAVMDGIADVLKDEAAKLITPGTLELVHAMNIEGLRENYFAITGYSRGVLANVRDSGLKRDLTAFMLSDGSIPDLSSSEAYYLGLNDNDFLVGSQNEKMAELRGFDWDHNPYHRIAPTFGVLRKWYEFSQSNTFSRQSMDQLAPEVWPNPPGCNDPQNVYDMTNYNTVQFVPFGQPNITPLLTEANVYYNLSTYPVDSGGTQKHAMRMCLYPRVSLWNPYSVSLRIPPMICQLFVNGGKQVEVKAGDKTLYREIYFGGYRDTRRDTQYGGMIFMRIPATEIPAGKTLVFSTESTQKLDIQNFSNNALSTSVAPSPDRYLYQDYNQPSELFDEMPDRYREFPKDGNLSGADNYMVSLKEINVDGPVTLQQFRYLPLFSYASVSLQAGGGDELPLKWNSDYAKVHPIASSAAILDSGAIPDVRTRDGFRLRWWKETESNIAGSGALSNYPGHLQSAALANWNLRGAYYCRTPFDNVSPLPPYFHGIYTRDLPDAEVEWRKMTPVLVDGQNTGFPFTSPANGPPGLIAFELPSRDVGIPSIAYLRHLKLSEFAWHPSYAIGNSLVDPRVPRTGTSPILEPSERSHGGWNAARMGADYWADLFREITFDTCLESNLVYDQSFEVNYNLWDDYFFSTGTTAQKQRFADDPGTNPLPNGRFGVFSGHRDLADDVLDFHRAASRLSVEGAFDIHSANKEAWKAILSSTRDIGFGTRGVTPYPRMLKVGGGDYLGELINEATYNGFRSLRNDEIDRLAEAMVEEVKKRAPFFGLADFVNRRLTEDETGQSGTIEAAISRAGINKVLIDEYPLDRSRELPDLRIAAPTTSMSDITRLRQQDKAESTAWGLPGYLTQGDVLQIIGSTLSARSDSFVIRAYGEAKDIHGNVVARAWCEGIVQRVPTPMDPDQQGLNPIVKTGGEVNFGRRFQMVSFRWLGEDEV